MNFEKLSANITDLPGVEGLCLIDQVGSVLFRRMPSFIPEDCYDEAVRRIIGLYETIDENFLPADDYVLKFQGKWLLFRRTGSYILMLMTTEMANLMSIRMVTNLTLKHLQSTPAIGEALRAAIPPKGGSAAGSPAPQPVAVAAAAASRTEASEPPAPAVAKQKPVRMYRGQILD